MILAKNGCVRHVIGQLSVGVMPLQQFPQKLSDLNALELSCQRLKIAICEFSDIPS